jgi:glycine/D-amino acid oxidase-like deaminating enzyme
MKKMHSSWMIHNTATYPQLKQDISTDILIIGSGITGILTAYLLAKEGKKIVLIDENGLENGATAYTTAFLTQLIDTSLTDQVKLFGKEKTKDIWDSHGIAINHIEQIIKQEKIECEFIKCDLHQFAIEKKDVEILQDEYTTAINLGIPVTLTKKNDLPFHTDGYITIPQQAKFHPIKFISELLKRIEKMHGKIYFGTKAIEITDTDPAIITTPTSHITANHVIIATHIPFHHPIEVFAKKGVYTSYVYELSVPKKTLPEALYLDTKNPYHYFRVDPKNDHDIVIIGGEDHRRDIPIDTDKNFSALKTYIEKTFSHIPYTITNQWSGPIIENDTLAYIGKIKKNQYIATGYSGNGMTYAAIAAIVFHDLILHKNNPWVDLYNPKRIPSVKQIVTKSIDYTEEFFNAAIKNMLQKKKN